jgi:hypothetical protein
VKYNRAGRQGRLFAKSSGISCIVGTRRILNPPRIQSAGKILLKVWGERIPRGQFIAFVEKVKGGIP